MKDKDTIITGTIVVKDSSVVPYGSTTYMILYLLLFVRFDGCCGCARIVELCDRGIKSIILIGELRRHRL